jgi:signal transduction histidine kinase
MMVHDSRENQCDLRVATESQGASMSLTRPRRTLRGWARNPHLPLHTVRTRLTLLYGALFLISGTVLLAITYGLAWNATTSEVGSPNFGPPNSGKAVIVSTHVLKQKLAELAQQNAAEGHQRAADMHQLLASAGIALLVTAVLSIAMGWLVAGRVLRPLRTMTTAAQRISEQNLHERLAIAGPDDELKQLGDTIDDLLARLEASFDAQRHFVANASHELRTPLTMMRTALDVATRKPDPPVPAVTILASKIRAGLDKADRLVESFLTLARAQHGSAVHRSTVALDKLAATVVADHCDAISGMYLTVGQDHHDAPVPGNEALLTHLTGNLIDNAIRYNQPGGWIRVATSTSTAAARLVVENSGPIVDPGRVGELTQPFRRAAPDRTDATGSAGFGLGLSIVAAIATTHHGTLHLHARPDGGLRVTVTLPLADRPALTAVATL